MNLTIKRKGELVVWGYFIPPNCKWTSKNEKDIEMFFEWSEKGMHKNIYFQKGKENSYFLALREGKKWAGIHWDMYEQGVLDGSMPYICLLRDSKRIYRKWYEFWKDKYRTEEIITPREVVNMMKKEMFKGMDSDVIEDLYQKTLDKQIA